MVTRLVVAFTVVVAAAAACAGKQGERRYPRRPPGCALTVYHSVMPEVTTWDDIGVAEVGCHLDESEGACLHRLRTEACRMGGDIIYNVPKRALRPLERAMIYRGRVAHTRDTPPNQPGEVKHAEASAVDPDAGSGSGPIVPLLPARDVMGAPADGGTDGGAPDGAT